MSDTLSTEKPSPTPSGKPVDAATACSPFITVLANQLRIKADAHCKAAGFDLSGSSLTVKNTLYGIAEALEDSVSILSENAKQHEPEP